MLSAPVRVGPQLKQKRSHRAYLTKTIHRAPGCQLQSRQMGRSRATVACRTWGAAPARAMTHSSMDGHAHSVQRYMPVPTPDDAPPAHTICKTTTMAQYARRSSSIAPVALQRSSRGSHAHQSRIAARTAGELHKGAGKMLRQVSLK